MDINKRISDVKEHVKKITSNFPYTEFEINVLVVCYIAITNIDSDIEDLLDEVLGRIFILFNEGQFNELLRSLDVPFNVGGAYHISCFNGKKRDYYEYIYANLYKNRVFREITMMIIFDVVLHELKHALNCTINKDNADVFYFGLGFCMKNTNDDFLVYLDEAFNTFITNIYLKEIGKLKSYDIQDSEIEKMINDVSGDYPESYKSTKLMERIFGDAELFKKFYNAALYHDVRPLFEKLNEIFFEGNGDVFENMCLLDKRLEKCEHGLYFEEMEYFQSKTSNYPERNLKIKSF